MSEVHAPKEAGAANEAGSAQASAQSSATGTVERGNTIAFEGVSRFYGEVLGVNGVNLSIPPGITSLVGPNGSGKTTLMNLMCGLIRPTEGRISVLGISPEHPEQLCRVLGYCAQFDAFPKGLSGYQFIYSYLRVFGMEHAECDRRTWEALARVSMTDAANRPVAAYSKGMRQRVKLAQAIAHEPRVLVLDEPLNGLDPMARAETIALFRDWGSRGFHVIVSSHILHEVDRISDQVILLSQGYVVAEGQIQGVRSEVKDQPMQILVRCNHPADLAARLFAERHAVEAKIHEDGKSISIRTADADGFYLLLNRIVMETGLEVEAVAPADDDVNSVYQYLIGGGDGGTV
jgi:ABC-2 type transport system ATP-binding protein